MVRTVLVAVVVAAFVGTVLLNRGGRTAPAIGRPIAAAQAVAQPAPDTEVAPLRAQIDEMRRAEDRLLQTVLWSLGIVALVGIGFLTFNIAQSRYFYDRDRQAKAADLRRDLDRGLDESRTAQEARGKEVRQQVAQVAEAVAQSIINQMEGQEYDLLSLRCDLVFNRTLGASQ